MLFGLLLINQNVYAEEYYVSNYYIDAYINEDGSMYVKELIIPEGSYNGYILNKRFSTSSMAEFTGSKSNFEGDANIYNAGSYFNLKVYDVKKPSSGWSFSAIDDLNYEYSQVATASTGAYGVYELDNVTNGFNIKMYNQGSNNEKGFYLA